jgi:hypothetical protein
MALFVHSLGMQRCMASSMWETQITALFWTSQLSGLSVLVIFHGENDNKPLDFGAQPFCW